MLDHLRCACGHLRMVHGGRTDTECRLCSGCYRFHWRVISRLFKTGPRAG